MRIDIHTHAYPESAAPRIVEMFGPQVSRYGEWRGTFHLQAPHSSPTVDHLADINKANGVDLSVLLPVATNPAKVDVINRWALNIRQGGGYPAILPFGAIHPHMRDPHAEIRWLRDNGFPGFKLHSVHQRFVPSSDPAWQVYQWAQDEGLIVLMDAGNYVRQDDLMSFQTRARFVAEIKKRLTGLRLIAAHMGGFLDWDDSENYLIGKFEDLYIDTACSFPIVSNLPKARAQYNRMLQNHPPDYLLRGSDIPFSNPADEQRLIEDSPLDAARKEKILGDNAARLLGIAPAASARADSAYELEAARVDLERLIALYNDFTAITSKFHLVTVSSNRLGLRRINQAAETASSQITRFRELAGRILGIYEDSALNDFPDPLIASDERLRTTIKLFVRLGAITVARLVKICADLKPEVDRLDPESFETRYKPLAQSIKDTVPKIQEIVRRLAEGSDQDVPPLTEEEQAHVAALEEERDLFKSLWYVIRNALAVVFDAYYDLFESLPPALNETKDQMQLVESLVLKFKDNLPEPTQRGGLFRIRQLLRAALPWLQSARDSASSISVPSAMDNAKLLLKLQQSLDEVIRFVEAFNHSWLGPGFDEETAPIQAVEILRNLVQTLQPINPFKKGIQIVENYPTDLPMASAGETGLWQVFLNILKNAAIHGKPTQITVSARQENEYVVVQIQDNGKGIPPENLAKVPLEPGSLEMVPRVISKGFTTGGTGRGLYISYKIIKRLGGRMEVASTVGEGTTFTIRLKIAA